MASRSLVSKRLTQIESTQRITAIMIPMATGFVPADRPVADAVKDGIEAAIKIYESLGAEVIELKVSLMQDYTSAGFFISPRRSVARPMRQ
jgi:hypothetical protein